MVAGNRLSRGQGARSLEKGNRKRETGRSPRVYFLLSGSIVPQVPQVPSYFLIASSKL
jgi:hypothetical protein